MPYLWLNHYSYYSSILAHRNYEQLGLKFRLFSAEILFNKGLAQIYMGRAQEGLADMEEARREKVTDGHNVIDDAIQDRGEGYTVFSIVRPVEYMKSLLLTLLLASWGALSSLRKENEEFDAKNSSQQLIPTRFSPFSNYYKPQISLPL